MISQWCSLLLWADTFAAGLHPGWDFALFFCCWHGAAGRKHGLDRGLMNTGPMDLPDNILFSAKHRATLPHAIYSTTATPSAWRGAPSLTSFHSVTPAHRLPCSACAPLCGFSPLHHAYRDFGLPAFAAPADYSFKRASLFYSN